MKQKFVKMKFKVLIVLAIIVFSWGSVMAQDKNQHTSDEGIQFFTGTWKEALKKAKNENKAIFLDVYASWCGPCKVLKKKTFPDAEAGKYFNENFINVTLDAEKGDGIPVAREFRVQAYPSLFILNAKGEPVVYYPGYLKPEELIELGKAGLENIANNN